MRIKAGRIWLTTWKTCSRTSEKNIKLFLVKYLPARRYPVLVAFLQQALLHHTDVVVELFDQCLWGCHSEAKQELEEFRKTMASSTNDKLRRIVSIRWGATSKCPRRLRG